MLFVDITLILGIYTIPLSGQIYESKTEDNFIENTEEKTELAENIIVAESQPEENNIIVEQVQVAETPKVLKQTESVQAQPPRQIEQVQEVVSEPYVSRYSFLLSSENVSEGNVKTAEYELDTLPQKMINAFKNNNWTITISNENISAKYFNGSYGNVKGVTLTAYNKIIIQNRTTSIQTSIVHEMGHFLDWYFNFPSLSTEFKNIYNAEVNTFKSRIPNSSCVSNEMEFFAHTFYYIIKDSSKCTPMALEYVRNYLNSI